MKKLLLLTLILCLVLPCFGCDTPDTPPTGDDSTDETTTEETTEEETTEEETTEKVIFEVNCYFDWLLEAVKQLIIECNPPRGEVVWNTYPLGGAVFPIVLPGFGKAKIGYSNHQVYLNEEPLITGYFKRFYLSDLTDDGYPELCFTATDGSDDFVLVYDYRTKSEVFRLSDRMKHDYTLLLEDGFLLIVESKYSTYDITRVGTFAYDGAKITVVWSDREPTKTML